MMGLGFGSMKHMMDVFKSNRGLLGRKRTPKEAYVDEMKSMTSRYSTMDVNLIREQVSKRLKRNHTEELIVRIGVSILATGLIVAVVWILVAVDFSVKVPQEKVESESSIDNTKLFNTFTDSQRNGLELQTDITQMGVRRPIRFIKMRSSIRILRVTTKLSNNFDLRCTTMTH